MWRRTGDATIEGLNAPLPPAGAPKKRPPRAAGSSLSSLPSLLPMHRYAEDEVEVDAFIEDSEEKDTVHDGHYRW
jgi:hypothetical protein